MEVVLFAGQFHVVKARSLHLGRNLRAITADQLHLTHRVDAEATLADRRGELFGELSLEIHLYVLLIRIRACHI